MHEAVNNPQIAHILNTIAGIPLSSPTLDFFGIPVQYLSYTASVISDHLDGVGDVICTALL